METVAEWMQRNGVIKHLSEKPWSEYTKADYTPTEWHRACLIHQHTGEITSKDQCKLPVKTPTGEVNRNGVHAAAAALAGARGGVQASTSQIAEAKAALKRLYSMMGEDAPNSLSHYGVKGMKWGVRKREKDSTPKSPVAVEAKTEPGKRVSTSGGAYHSPHEDAIRAAVARQKIKASTIDALSNKELRDAVDRMGLEQRYGELLAKQPLTGKQRIIRNAKNLMLEFVGDEAANYAGTRYGAIGESVVDNAFGEIRGMKPDEIGKMTRRRQEGRAQASKQNQNKNG